MAEVSDIPAEVLLEIFKWIIRHDLAINFSAYGRPVDACVLSWTSPPDTFCDDRVCIQDGAHSIIPLPSARYDPRIVERIFVAQARGAITCVDHPSSLEFLRSLRQLSRVSRRWKAVAEGNWRLWPLKEDGTRVSAVEAKAMLFPLRISSEHVARSFLSLDALCSSAFLGLPPDWLQGITHASLSLPRTRITEIPHHGFGSSHIFCEHLASADVLTFLELRGTYTKNHYYCKTKCLLDLVNLHTSRLINCDIIVAGPNLRTLYIVALFSMSIMVKDVLLVLSRTLHLELLHLRTAHFDYCDLESAPSAISLPDLRHIVLSSQKSSIDSFLSRLQLPPHIEMHLETLSVECPPGELVPYLFYPESSQTVAAKFESDEYQAIICDRTLPPMLDLFGAPTYSHELYDYIGVNIGLIGDLSLATCGPEFVQVVLAGRIADALHCMADTSCGPSASDDIRRPPCRSLSIRVHHWDREEVREQLIPFCKAPLGDEWFSIDIRRVVEQFLRHSALPLHRTMVIGEGSYSPQTDAEWFALFRDLCPRRLVISKASFDGGQGETPRGMRGLRALAKYLKSGYRERVCGTQRPATFNTCLRHILVSPTCLGNSPVEIDSNLAKLQKNSVSAKKSPRGGVATVWEVHCAD